MNIAFFGSSLVSAYWNGAAPTTAASSAPCTSAATRSPSTSPTPTTGRRTATSPTRLGDGRRLRGDRRGRVRRLVAARGRRDVVVKASGVGVFDDVLEAAVVELRATRPALFWDVDAPATLGGSRATRSTRCASCCPATTGPHLRRRRSGDRALPRARRPACVPVYNALDPATHHPVAPAAGSAPTWRSSATACRTARRGCRVLLRARSRGPRTRLPARRQRLGGHAGRANLRHLGHVSPGDHNALNCTPRAVLNVSRESMAANGFSPATRVFEAAGAGACLITDAWEGIEEFLEPGAEVLVAPDGGEVAALLGTLTRRARRDRRGGAPAGARGAHLRASARRRWRRSWRRADEDRLPRPVDHLVVGQRPRHQLPGLVRELSRRGHEVLFCERDVPWYAAHRDLPQPPYGGRCSMTRSRARSARATSARRRSRDRRLLRARGRRGRRLGARRPPGCVAFYDIDTPVTLAKLERDGTST